MPVLACYHFTIYLEQFLIPQISETLKGSYTKFFGTVRQKILDGKLWYPLLCQKLFETKNFLKNSKIPLRKFSALWDIKFSTENRDKPPLIHNFFLVPEYFRKTEGFLYKAFRFGPVRQKISTKPWCPPSCAWKFSIKEFFWNTKVFSNEIFRYSETKTPTGNRDTPHLIHKIFVPIRNFLKHRMVFWRCFFGPVRLKNFRQNREASPLLCLKFFDTRILSKHRRALLRILSTLWDKDFSTELVISPSYA